MSETYAETAVLVAVMEENGVLVDQLLDDMLPNELRAFSSQLSDLLDAVDATLDRKETQERGKHA